MRCQVVILEGGGVGGVGSRTSPVRVESMNVGEGHTTHVSTKSP